MLRYESYRIIKIFAEKDDLTLPTRKPGPSLRIAKNINLPQHFNEYKIRPKTVNGSYNELQITKRNDLYHMRLILKDY